jgi:hypothetical protein
VNEHRLPLDGTIFGQIVDLSRIEQVLKLAIEPFALFATALGVDKHEERTGVGRNADLERSHLVARGQRRVLANHLSIGRPFQDRREDVGGWQNVVGQRSEIALGLPLHCALVMNLCDNVLR